MLLASWRHAGYWLGQGELAEAEAVSLVVVLNWYEEFKQQ